MSLVAIGIVTISLSIFGFFLLGIINLGNVVSDLSSRLDLVAYADGDLSYEEAGKVQVRISQIGGVEEVNFISKEEAWKNFKKDYAGKIDLQEIVDDNPLPHSFAVAVKTPDLLPVIAKEISKINDISEIRYSGKLISRIQTLVEVIRVSGFILVLLLFFATLLIVVNTIRLTVLARETDIYIMRLVGATNSLVKWPFVVEGIIIGILGGILGVLLLKGSYEFISSKLVEVLPFLPIVVEPRLLSYIYLSVGITGTFLGMLGGYISVSGLLKRKD